MQFLLARDLYTYDQKTTNPYNTMGDMVDAARANDIETLKRLLVLEKAQKSQVDAPQEPNDLMQNASYAAARHNNCKALEILLDNGCQVGPNTLREAMIGRCQEVIDLVISRGWDISSAIDHMGDPLLRAIGADDLEMVQFLLSRGADPNANTTLGSSRALEFATMCDSTAILEAIFNAGGEMEKRNALPKAAENGKLDAIRFLLERGANIDEIPDNDDILDNQRDIGVKNALCKAAWCGQVEALKLLLEYGADPNIRDTNGNTALELAESRGSEACVKLLKDIHWPKSGREKKNGAKFAELQ